MAIFNSYFDITRGYTSSCLLPRSSGLWSHGNPCPLGEFFAGPPKGIEKRVFPKKTRVVAILLVGVSVYVTITYYYCTYIYIDINTLYIHITIYIYGKSIDHTKSF